MRWSVPMGERLKQIDQHLCVCPSPPQSTIFNKPIGNSFFFLLNSDKLLRFSSFVKFQPFAVIWVFGKGGHEGRLFGHNPGLWLVGGNQGRPHASPRLISLFRDAPKKKIRENVGIFPKWGTPPPPPCLGMPRLFEEKNHVFFLHFRGCLPCKKQ